MTQRDKIRQYIIEKEGVLAPLDKKFLIAMALPILAGAIAGRKIGGDALSTLKGINLGVATSGAISALYQIFSKKIRLVTAIRKYNYAEKQNNLGDMKEAQADIRKEYRKLPTKDKEKIEDWLSKNLKTSELKNFKKIK